MSTTSPAVPYCGVYCNASIVINPWTPSDVFQWESENWGIADYPEDCICTLNVQVVHSLVMFENGIIGGVIERKKTNKLYIAGGSKF